MNLEHGFNKKIDLPQTPYPVLKNLLADDTFALLQKTYTPKELEAIEEGAKSWRPLDLKKIIQDAGHRKNTLH